MSGEPDMSIDGIVVSPATLKDWERKQSAALARAEEATNEARVWGQKIQAARIILFGEVPPVDLPKNGELSLIDAIEAIAQEAKPPISNKEMKNRLRALGFSESKLDGNYYYTVTGRLNDQGRIVIDEKKRIGPAPNRK